MLWYTHPVNQPIAALQVSMMKLPSSGSRSSHLDDLGAKASSVRAVTFASADGCLGALDYNNGQFIGKGLPT